MYFLKANPTIKIKTHSHKVLKSCIVQEKTGRKNITKGLYMHLTFDFFRAYKNMLIEIWVKFSVYLPLTCSLTKHSEYGSYLKSFLQSRFKLLTAFLVKLKNCSNTSV